MDLPPIEIDFSVEIGPDADENVGDTCPTCGAMMPAAGDAMATPKVSAKSRGSAPVTTAEAAQRRAAAMSLLPPDKQRRTIPNDGERARALPFSAKMRTRAVERDGRQFHEVLGYASTVDQSYKMWDVFGEYEEEVAGDAFDRTLAASPDVAFLLNHRGMTMARTTNGSLELSVDALGLRSQAWLNPERRDVQDLVSAIRDGLVDEMSFAFMIDDAEWNDDFTRFRIQQVNLDRGDVSAVNYGANPHTSITARMREIMHDVDHLPVGAARAAYARLQYREDLASPIMDLCRAAGTGMQAVHDLAVKSGASCASGAKSAPIVGSEREEDSTSLIASKAHRAVARYKAMLED
jgi:HK97 family phage prohead protease